MSESRDAMTSQTTHEGELVNRARKGDAKAFEDLVRMHQRALYRYLCWLSGDTEDAMELTQSSFVKAYLSMGRFRGESSFKTYLFRIASNTWKNCVRDRGRRQNVNIEDVPVLSGNNPHDEVAREQEQERFWKLVEELPARQKEALVLRLKEGYPFEKVAEVMGCSTGAAKASYHHAVGKLKSSFYGEDQ